MRVKYIVILDTRKQSFDVQLGRFERDFPTVKVFKTLKTLGAVHIGKLSSSQCDDMLNKVYVRSITSNIPLTIP